MKKLFCSDIDGTLIKSDLSISKETIDMIKIFIDKGNVFSIVTGRFKAGLLHLLKEMPYEIPFSCLNGAYTEYKNEILDNKPLSFNDLNTLLSFLSNYDISPIIFSLNDWFCKEKDKTYYDLKSIYKNDAIITEFTKNTILKYAPLGVYKIMLRSDNKILNDEILFDLKEEFKDYFEYERTGDYQFEVMPKGINKANALKVLSSYFNIKDTYAAGDFDNDLQMLKIAKVSFAMFNANDKIKKIATHITSSCDEDGVAKALKSIL